MEWIVATAALPSLVVSFLVAALARRVAPRIGLVDHPGARKIHERVRPYGGGLAIWAGIVLPLAFGHALLASSVDREQSSEMPRVFAATGELGERTWQFVEPHLDGLSEEAGDLWMFLAGGTVLLVLGLADDVKKLDWRFRLLVEVMVAAAVVFGRGWQFTVFLDWPLLTGCLSVLWIVTLVNSFNMLDNMDGLSAGVAMISGLGLATTMLITSEEPQGSGQFFIAGLLFLLVGSLLGFLWHNWPPARLFMGDAGAYFIGYFLAVAAILGTFAGSNAPRHAVLTPVCALAIPLYDMVSVLWIRFRAGRSPFHGDTNHFSHRLVALGLSQTQAVLTIYLATAACGLAALVLRQVDTAGAIVLFAGIGCLLGVIAILESTARRKMNS